MTKKIKAFTLGVAALLLASCSGEAADSYVVPFEGNLSHVHGLGYAGDENALYFASHHGLKIYRDGKWFETPDNFHDYMGFNATDEGFYTSGHPGAGSDLPNPLGIQRSEDGGKTIEEVAFQGETDFHAMAAGYNSHDLFLINPAKNSQLEAGVYKSGDQGKTWQPVKAKGLIGDVASLALHPTDSDYLAAATSAGVFLSKDAGATFRALTPEGERGTAVHFTKDGLFYGSFGTVGVLMKYTVENEALEKMDIPDLSDDAIAYIAQNPADEQELAFYTLRGHAYLSEDSTQNWEQLLDTGKTE